MLQEMNIILNGEPRRVRAGRVGALLEELTISPASSAVELNGAIVPRSRHGEQALSEGDRVEIVRFIGGG